MSQTMNPLSPQDQAQIETIYDRYKDRLAKQILCMVKNEHNMKDIRQTVFLELCKQWQTVKTLPEPALYRWLLTTSKNTSLNFLKKNQRDQSQLTLDNPETLTEPSFVVDFETEIFDQDHPVEIEALLDWVSEQLKETERPLFDMLRRRLPGHEIIRRNGKSVGATRVQISRLKARTKELILLYLEERNNSK